MTAFLSIRLKPAFLWNKFEILLSVFKEPIIQYIKLLTSAFTDMTVFAYWGQN